MLRAHGIDMSSAPIEEQLDAISEQNRRLALEKDELTEQNGELVSRNGGGDQRLPRVDGVVEQPATRSEGTGDE